MSVLKSVLENQVMADIYTCSVCGMKIPLNILTEHVLLHDQYSAFSYNETTKIIEPLDEVQEQLLQDRHTPSHFPHKPTYEHQQEAYPYITAGTSEPVENPEVTLVGYPNGMPVQYHNSQSFNADNMSPTQNNQTRSYHIAPHLEKKLSTAPLESLTGIQMIASVAETLGKNGLQEINSVCADELGRLNINTPLNPGDVIGMIKLPYMENFEESNATGLLCECSIVFNRFVGIVDIKEYSVETRKATQNSEISLQDIIDGEEEDFGKDCISPDLEISKQKKPEQTTLRAGQTGRKMEVYKYKEPEVASGIQNELQKSIVTVPELLQDPAVVKYLETMTGKAIEPVNEKSLTSLVPDLKKEQNTENGEDNDNSKNILNFNTEQEIVQQPNTPHSSSEAIEQSYECSDLNLSNENNKNVGTKKDVILGDSDLKKNRIVVKWDQNTAGFDIKANKYHCMDKALTDKIKERNVQSNNIGCIDELAGCENDDEEQEMMDVESDIEETDSQTERKDFDSENQLSFGKASPKKKPCETSDSKTYLENQLSSKNLQFSCSVCKKMVDSLENLRKHFLTHEAQSTEPKKSLRVINKKISSLSKMVSESFNKPVDHSSNMVFYCMVCDKMFPSQQELHEHCEIHRKTNDFVDSFVKPDGTSASEETQTADSDVDFDAETIRHAGKSKLQRKKSKRKSLGKMKPKEENSDNKTKSEEKEKSRGKMNEVSRKKTISKDYICEYCGEGFLDIQKCIAHSEQCTETGKLKCFQGCGYIFKSSSELDFHKKFCSRRLAYLDRISKEMVKKEQMEETYCDKVDNDELENVTFFCPFCDQQYPTEEKKNYHKLVCRGRPKQKCDHCDFECKGDKSMAKHLVEKHNLKPFKCSQCSRSFKLKGSLRDHIRYTHTKETFTCEYCGKSFIKQSVYRSHVSIQHEGFRLVCSYCGKKFKDKRTWVIHEKSHKGAYEYACTLCKKTFNRCEQYKSHMQEVHSIEEKAAISLNSAAKELREKLCSNVCSICKETFPLEAAYAMHMSKVHSQA